MWEAVLHYKWSGPDRASLWCHNPVCPNPVCPQLSLLGAKGERHQFLSRMKTDVKLGNEFWSWSQDNFIPLENTQAWIDWEDIQLWHHLGQSKCDESLKWALTMESWPQVNKGNAWGPKWQYEGLRIENDKPELGSTGLPLWEISSYKVESCTAPKPHPRHHPGMLPASNW